VQYMLLIYEPESAYEGEAGARLLSDVVAKHMALATELRASGVQKDGAGLQGVAAARTVSSRGAVHDGPFAETREQLGGYYVVEAGDMDEALAIARRIPVADGGKVEVRPLMAH